VWEGENQCRRDKKVRLCIEYQRLLAGYAVEGKREMEGGAVLGRFVVTKTLISQKPVRFV